MLRSLFSGISSLRSHQTMLDVTGNNIANVNTTGYKAARTQFEDTLSQVIQNAGAPQAGQGGTNPAQVGLGVQVSAITNDFTDGATQQTGRALDMKITGDGFFIVNNGTEQLYTRAGAFTLDALGQLTTASGALVQGWSAVNGVIDTAAGLGPIRLPVSTTMGATATQNVVFSGNMPSDLSHDDPNTVAVEPTILTRAIDVYDAAGNSRSLELVFTKTVPPTVAGAASEWAISTTDSTGAAITGTIAFGGDGALVSAVLPAVDGVNVTFAELTGYAKLTTVEAASQDGKGAGTLQSFSMNADGTLIGSFSNGFKEPVGQIALANFANAAGLEKAGGTAFRSTVNSGDAQVGVGGTGGRGALTSRALEMSNVDLSQEFTNLIIAQRGFQAGSRVITTSDELLQELVNLKR
ncbi:flagellar hook protein FlgE [Georgenia yuyongxinii]|uniref:Flagellar hook protein FlgE n=1 Tax=Georgenia yuyongxinii TaxID=2589797 RepID=A0A5B8BZA3_9MICO|nr:flagellar hook protein FlgE [Georgenia yuyongxinii]QDC23644.1 flagellar hook protein FlgE [Georgenia yuyongxinii]